jgi:hypothetical protein
VRSIKTAVLLGVLGSSIAACARAEAPAVDTATKAMSAADSAYVALLERGKEVMGVNQITSNHVFEASPDGGSISLQRDSVDEKGTLIIRMHMLEVASRFSKGDYSLSEAVHAQPDIPGTAVMKARKDKISFLADTLPRGAILRITTTDSAALSAVHEFLAFQRMDHRTGDHGAGHAHPAAK